MKDANYFLNRTKQRFRITVIISFTINDDTPYAYSNCLNVQQESIDKKEVIIAYQKHLIEIGMVLVSVSNMNSTQECD